MEADYRFKTRMCDQDWEMLLSIIRRGDVNPKLNGPPQRIWVRNRLIHFCNHVALGILSAPDNDSSITDRQIIIQDVLISDTSLLRILEMVAEKKQKTIAQIVQKYIIDFPMVNEEFERARISKGMAISEFYRHITSQESKSR